MTQSHHYDDQMIQWHSLLSCTETADAFEYSFHRLPCADLMTLQRDGDVLRLKRGCTEIASIKGVHGQIPLGEDPAPLLWLTTARDLFPEAIRVCHPHAGDASSPRFSQQDMNSFAMRVTYPQKSRNNSVDKCGKNLPGLGFFHG